MKEPITGRTKKEKEIYRREWNKANYSRINVYLRPEAKERWQKAAEKGGFKSLNNFVISYMEEVVESYGFGKDA